MDINNLLIVSDHGMEGVPPDHLLRPGQLLADARLARAQVGGPLLYFRPAPGHDAAVAAALLRPQPHSRCWRREALPARFHYGRNPRVPPFVCLADSGWRFSTEAPLTYAKGEHGFDPLDPAMRALFLAVGPAFQPGRTLADFDNVDVYPLARALIGLPPATGIDGSAARFDQVLRREGR